MLELFVPFLKIAVAISIFYVWVVRYENIINEFAQYNIPNWFRDFIGITKLILAATLVSQSDILYIVAAFGIVILMSAAVFTHFKFKNPAHKAIPSFTLLSICLYLGTTELLAS